jgi:hypothetical protein
VSFSWSPGGGAGEFPVAWLDRAVGVEKRSDDGASGLQGPPVEEPLKLYICSPVGHFLFKSVKVPTHSSCIVSYPLIVLLFLSFVLLVQVPSVAAARV